MKRILRPTKSDISKMVNRLQLKLHIIEEVEPLEEMFPFYF